MLIIELTGKRTFLAGILIFLIWFPSTRADHGFEAEFPIISEQCNFNLWGYVNAVYGANQVPAAVQIRPRATLGCERYPAGPFWDDNGIVGRLRVFF